jgi:hypothetical protein
MLPLFTPFIVDIDKNALKPYIAPVNLNVLNETTWVNIVHTLLVNFGQETDNHNNTMPMEDMGHDACVVVGYHTNVSVFTP